jgi:glycosyltransferase involved in cell wall biosynthesis
MKLLHISGRYLIEGNGIASAVPPLITAQNELDGVEANILFTSAGERKSIPNYSFDSFYLIEINDFEYFLLHTYKPDLVVFHEIYYSAFLKLYKLLIKLTIPYVIHPHNSLTLTAQNQKKIVKKFVNYFFFKSFIRSAANVSYLNESEYLTSIYRRKDPIFVPNGVQMKDLSYLSKKINKVKIIFFSRIDYYLKGIDVLLEAVKLIRNELFVEKDFEILLFGDGKKEDLKKLDKKLRSINNSFVKYKGPVYGDEKSDILKTSHIFILPSRLEGMPMSILEALSYGLPCIITSETNMSEIIIKKHIGWLINHNPQEIAVKIIQAVDEYRNDYESYIDNCTSVARDIYDWKKIALASIRQYREIIFLKKREDQE